MKKYWMKLLANWINVVFLLQAVVLLSACNDIGSVVSNSGPDENAEVVARVYDNYLYKKDLDGLGGGADSTQHAEAFVRNWIKKQLMVEEATRTIDYDEAEIERKVLDYRYALLLHEYERYVVNTRLKKEVLEEEIRAYYDEFNGQFQLKQNVIRGLYVKVPKDAPRQNSLRRLMTRADTREDLEAYCYQYADNYNLDDSTWVSFDDAIKDMPLSSTVTDKGEFLKRTNLSVSSDDDFSYYLKIEEYKISGEIPPLQFVSDDIVNIIINKRKTKLAEQHREDMYNEAKRNKDFEIYE